MDGGIEQLLLRGQQQKATGVSTSLLNAFEAERIVEQLQAFSIEEVGSAAWHSQHERLEQLNLQAHYNAQSHSDEFVVELLVSLDKMVVIVHDLIVSEAWKLMVLPHLRKHLAHKVDPLIAYLLVYHEAAVVNLLEVTLFHQHACEALPEDHLLELCDWCYRKLQYLNTEGHADAEYKERSAQEMVAQGREEEQREKEQETNFAVATSCLTILRYLSDYLPKLPLGLLGRMVSTNDTPMALVPLLDRPPWVRRRPGRLEKFINNKWITVEPADRLKLTQQDAQVWMTLNNLLVDPRSRARYGLHDDYRRDKLMTLKRYMNELLFDQLPILKDLCRVLDEMARGVGVDASSAKASALILEQVPVVRESILRGRDWKALAIKQAREYFGEASHQLAKGRAEAMLKSLEFLCDLDEPASNGGTTGGTGTSGRDAGPAVTKVECLRKVHGDVYESWCSFTLEVDTSKPAEPVELGGDSGGASTSGTSGQAGAKGSSSSSGSSGVLHGLRYRLKALDIDSTRPLPTNGKAVVRHGGALAEALLQLPELPLRTSGEGAAVLWVTVGLLATDGLALQLKLKKADKPKERDKLAGVWYAYHPVGGAITVLQPKAAQ